MGHFASNPFSFFVRAVADSGFLVALGIERDPRHRAARNCLDNYTGELLVPAPVVSEACYFLSTAAKVRLLDWLRKPPRKVLDLPVAAYPEVGEILARYADLDADFTDAAIVWLAKETDCRAILTVDVCDFSVFRLKIGKRFELVKWFEHCLAAGADLPQSHHIKSGAHTHGPQTPQRPRRHDGRAGAHLEETQG